jgi:hypothetical protein
MIRNARLARALSFVGSMDSSSLSARKRGRGSIRIGRDRKLPISPSNGFDR